MYGSIANIEVYVTLDSSYSFQGNLIHPLRDGSEAKLTGGMCVECVCIYYSPSEAPNGCMGPVPANQQTTQKGEHPTSRSDFPTRQ